jgi:hypothetical protein
LVCNAASLKASRSANRTNLPGTFRSDSPSTSAATSGYLSSNGRSTTNATTQDERRNLLNAHSDKQARVFRKSTEGSASFSSKAAILGLLHRISKCLPLVPKLWRHQPRAELGYAPTRRAIMLS